MNKGPSDGGWGGWAVWLEEEEAGEGRWSERRHWWGDSGAP